MCCLQRYNIEDRLVLYPEIVQREMHLQPEILEITIPKNPIETINLDDNDNEEEQSLNTTPVINTSNIVLRNIENSVELIDISDGEPTPAVPQKPKKTQPKPSRKVVCFKYLQGQCRQSYCRLDHPAITRSNIVPQATFGGKKPKKSDDLCVVYQKKWRSKCEVSTPTLAI